MPHLHQIGACLREGYFRLHRALACVRTNQLAVEPKYIYIIRSGGGQIHAYTLLKGSDANVAERLGGRLNARWRIIQAGFGDIEHLVGFGV